jgi:hypothetical protein
MHEMTIAFAFLAMVFAPCVVSVLSTRGLEE